MKKEYSKWLDYPANEPELGEEIVVCYGDNNKKEVVQWQMKFIGSRITMKFLRMPPIKNPTKKNKSTIN